DLFSSSWHRHTARHDRRWTKVQSSICVGRVIFRPSRRAVLPPGLLRVSRTENGPLPSVLLYPGAGDSIGERSIIAGSWTGAAQSSGALSIVVVSGPREGYPAGKPAT